MSEVESISKLDEKRAQANDLLASLSPQDSMVLVAFQSEPRISQSKIWATPEGLFIALYVVTRSILKEQDTPELIRETLQAHLAWYEQTLGQVPEGPGKTH